MASWARSAVFNCAVAVVSENEKPALQPPTGRRLGSALCPSVSGEPNRLANLTNPRNERRAVLMRSGPPASMGRIAVNAADYRSSAAAAVAAAASDPSY